MNKRMIIPIVLIVGLSTLLGTAFAHDGWVQSNVPRVNVNNMVYVDMQFGNHQNMHRDYKIYASKWDINKSTFTLHTPSGEMVDFKSRVADVGMDEVKTLANGTITYTDRNGYLVASFVASQKGMYIVDVRQDTVVSYAPERSIKCTKAIVGAIQSSFRSNAQLSGYDEMLGQLLEIIPLKDPTDLAVGDTLPFQILFKGFPLQDAEVSVIPRGTTLPPMGTPNPYDLCTYEQGKASFTFTEANYHLIVAHKETDENGTLDGKSYSMTKYAAALTVIISPTHQQGSSSSSSILFSGNTLYAAIVGLAPTLITVYIFKKKHR